MKLDKALIGYVDLMHPGLVQLPVELRFMHVETLAWSATFRTNGAVLREQLGNITRTADPEAGAAALVKAGVWEATPVGWQIPWSEQISADEAQRITDKNRAQWAAYKRHQRGDHGQWCPKSCKSRQDSAADSPLDNGGAPDLTSPDRTGPDLTGPSGNGRVRSGNRRNAQQHVDDAVAVPAERVTRNGPRPSVVRHEGATGPATLPELDEALAPHRDIVGRIALPDVAERAAAMIPAFGSWEVARTVRLQLRGRADRGEPIDWPGVYADAERALGERFHKPVAVPS